jgi:beta-glucanase (GH16 family)
MLALAAPVAAMCACSASVQVQHESVRPTASASTLTRLNPVPASAAKAPSPPKGKPEFSASFYGTRLNTKVWETCYPWDSQSGCSNFGNKEYQWFMPGQDRVSKGILSLSAWRVATKGKNAAGKPEEYGCRSGMITTYKSFHFTYGFVQIVAKVPHSTGLWPALWFAAADLKFPPEFDMIEDWAGTKTETATFFHPVGAAQDRGLIPESLTKTWQTYSLSWTKSRLTFYVGKKVILTVTKRVPHQAMYFLADVAEYMKPAKGDCSGEMQIRSVKVWK